MRGCPFVSAVTEVGATDPQARKISKAFKESRRQWFCDQITKLGVANPELLATQLVVLVDGAIAQNLVRRDRLVARAARDVAQLLLVNAGVKIPAV